MHFRQLLQLLCTYEVIISCEKVFGVGSRTAKWSLGCLSRRSQCCGGCFIDLVVIHCVLGIKKMLLLFLFKKKMLFY